MSYTVCDTEALVLHHWPHKDSSRKLLLYTRDIGRIIANAQAVRKVDAKLKSALQTYSNTHLSLVFGRGGWRVVGAAPNTNYHLSATDSAGTALLSRVNSLFLRLVAGQEADPLTYNILTAGYGAVVDPDIPNDLLERLLVFRILARLGYAPDKEAGDLTAFLDSDDYSKNTLKEFAQHSEEALKQINQSLATTQL